MAEANSTEAEQLLDKHRFEESYDFEDWKFQVVRDHIMPSGCPHEKKNKSPDCSVCTYAEVLSELKHLPDMVFSENHLRISHKSGACLELNALDALKLVDCKSAEPNLKVAPSKEWTEARKDSTHLTVQKPFDWTFTTEYKGTDNGFTISPTEQHIDLNSLRVHEPILFYEEVPLFEDELADHGCSLLSVKVRVMPSGFFALLRFYLRVDHVLVRILDTRIRWRLGDRQILREWSKRQQPIDEMSEQQKVHLRDPNALWPTLPVVAETFDQLSW